MKSEERPLDKYDERIVRRYVRRDSRVRAYRILGLPRVGLLKIWNKDRHREAHPGDWLISEGSKGFVEVLSDRKFRETFERVNKDGTREKPYFFDESLQRNYQYRDSSVEAFRLSSGGWVLENWMSHLSDDEFRSKYRRPTESEDKEGLTSALNFKVC